jgi:hypothetical protein
MFAYFSNRYTGAIYLEFKKELGAQPVFAVNNCMGETVIDLPFVQIIITPRSKLSDYAAKNDCYKSQRKKGRQP